MTRVALLWHMHQPYYEDLVTGEHILPWVRLHALKDYFGMAALLREFPKVRATFNLVPSLLVQLEAFAGNRARDRHLELSLKPASQLTEGDAAFIAENFFHTNREHLIGLFPRYVELFERRGSRLGVEDLRDLQVLHKLAWLDPIYRDHDPRVKGLIEKGKGFSEDDKATAREVELEILNRVIPEYRDAQARGQVELSTSPFYHPILPLLCDTDVYLTTHPDSRMPRHRFQRPEDARDQLREAVSYFERVFGQRPVGLWPSEGSVSDAMVPLAAESGFTWMATDELVLARTLKIGLERDERGQLLAPEVLYAPRTVQAGGATIACLFRDHLLSDLIGFTYAGWDAESAAADFCGRLVEAGRRYSERTGGGEATIPIILDGENAWEHFPGGGRPFLRALYARLSDSPDLQTVTMSEAAGAAGSPAPASHLSGIFPGSWIDANFYIWIGHEDDHRAWTQLAEARQALEEAGDPRLAERNALYERARHEIFIAEGSDWFWWYGDDHFSDQDAAFDELFRRHLRNVYRLLGRSIPDDLFVTNITTAPRPVQIGPVGFVSPSIDGEDTSYFEWLGAGAVRGDEAAGAMHQAEARAQTIELLRYGFDRERLYIRVDGRQPMVDVLAGGVEFWVKFLAPERCLFRVRQIAGRMTSQLTRADSRSMNDGSAAAVGSVLEAAVPFATLEAKPGMTLAFFIALVDAGGSELERHPANGPIELVVPDLEFAARNWNV